MNLRLINKSCPHISAVLHVSTSNWKLKLHLNVRRSHGCCVTAKLSADIISYFIEVERIMSPIESRHSSTVPAL